jgi:uncharacterized Tic20 family protein
MDANSSSRTPALLAHLLGIFFWFVPSLVVWLISKNDPEKSFACGQAKEALNFQITLTLVAFICGIVAALVPVVGKVIGPVLGVVNIVFCIMAALAANKGTEYRYPVSLRLIK